MVALPTSGQLAVKGLAAWQWRHLQLSARQSLPAARQDRPVAHLPKRCFPCCLVACVMAMLPVGRCSSQGWCMCCRKPQVATRNSLLAHRRSLLPRCRPCPAEQPWQLHRPRGRLPLSRPSQSLPWPKRRPCRPELRWLRPRWCLSSPGKMSCNCIPHRKSLLILPVDLAGAVRTAASEAEQERTAACVSATSCSSAARRQARPRRCALQLWGCQLSNSQQH